MRLKIGAKLAIGFLCMILLAGTAGWWSYQTLVTLQAGYNGLMDKEYPTSLAALSLNAEIHKQSQMIMAYAATRDDKAIESVKASREVADAAMTVLQSAADHEADLADSVKAIEDQRTRFNRMVNTLFVDGDGLSADQLLLSAEQARSVGNTLSKAVDGLVSQVQDRVASERKNVAAQAATALRLLMIIALVALVLSVAIIMLAQVMIARPVGRIAAELQRIASGAGDLTRRIHVRTGDELQALAEAFNQMQQSLQGIVKQVVESSALIVERTRDVELSTESVAAATEQVQRTMENVATGANSQVHNVGAATGTLDELLAAISQIASGASQQAEQVQETIATVNTMVQSMKDVAEHSSQVSDAALQAAETANKGAGIVDQTLEGMKRIRDKVVNTAQRIEELDAHSRRIGEIMTVITDIAGQTNLLALNAAIEAARAGEHGRGFAVVAEEVRKLAERAASSAKEIRSLIQNIQVGTAEAVAAIDEGARDVEAGAELAAEAGQALKVILQSVERTTHGIHSISAASQEVLSATRNVAAAVEEVAAVSQENSAATEEMAAGASQVSATMANLQSVSLSNSSAVEEVSASMEEVTHSTSSIAGSAKDLSDIASELRRIMTQFKVD